MGRATAAVRGNAAAGVSDDDGEENDDVDGVVVVFVPAVVDHMSFVHIRALHEHREAGD